MARALLRPEQAGVFAAYGEVWHTPALAGGPEIERDNLYRADCGEAVEAGAANVIRRPMTLWMCLQRRQVRRLPSAGDAS